MKNTRQEVYEALDTERDYQDAKWGNFDDANNHPADWILYIEHHLNKAKDAIYNSHDMYTFNEQIRKVTGLGVACMEQHGAQKREVLIKGE